MAKKTAPAPSNTTLPRIKVNLFDTTRAKQKNASADEDRPNWNNDAEPEQRNTAEKSKELLSKSNTRSPSKLWSPPSSQHTRGKKQCQNAKTTHWLTLRRNRPPAPGLEKTSRDRLPPAAARFGAGVAASPYAPQARAPLAHSSTTRPPSHSSHSSPHLGVPAPRARFPKVLSEAAARSVLLASFALVVGSSSFIRSSQATSKLRREIKKKQKKNGTKR